MRMVAQITHIYNGTILYSLTESSVYDDNLIFIKNPDNNELVFLGVVSTDGTRFYSDGVYTLEGYDTNENPITTHDSPIKFNKTYLSDDNETQYTSIKFYENGSADSMMVENGEIVNSSNMPANSFVYSGSVLYSLEGDNYNAIGAITSDGTKIYLFGGTIMHLND